MNHIIENEWQQIWYDNNTFFNQKDAYFGLSFSCVHLFFQVLSSSVSRVHNVLSQVYPATYQRFKRNQIRKQLESCNLNQLCSQVFRTNIYIHVMFAMLEA